MNRRLRDHLTSGFRLTLSHEQCRALVAIERAELPSETAWQLLEAKGLARTVGTEEEPEAALTAAGNLVVRLIAEAGLHEFYNGGEDHDQQSDRAD